MPGDVPVKFTLNTNERQALEGVRKMDAALDATTEKARRAAREITNVEKAMSQIVKQMGFAGSASTAQWLSKALPRVDTKTVQSGFLGQNLAQQARVMTNQLAADIEKLKQSINSDPGRLARARASNERYSASFGDDAVSRRKATKAISGFIKTNELGAVDDEVTRYVSRIAMGLRDRVVENAKRVFAAAGGSKDVLKMAESAGVNVGSPQAVRSYLGAMKQTAFDDAESTRMANTLRRQIAAEDEPDRQAAFIRKQIADEQAAEARSAEARRIALAKSKARGHKWDMAYAQRRSAEKIEEIEGSDILAGGVDALGAPEAPSAAERRKRAIGRKWTSGYAQRRREEPIERPGGDLLDNAVDEMGATSSPSTWDGEDWARKNRRSNRRALARSLRQRRFMRRLDAGMMVAGQVGGVLDAGVLATEGVLGAYNGIMAEQLPDLAGVERLFRERVGMAGSALDQKKIRQNIIGRSIQYGIPVAQMAAFEYDVMSSAGNLSAGKQRELMQGSLKYNDVAGGELPIQGQLLVTATQMYGDKLGSTDRAAAIIKRAVDYGKFSPTAFAQLAPEALSTASLYGIPFEEAAASLAVASTRSGRNENMFTGARYVFSLMGKARASGLVKSRDFLPAIKELRGATPDQMVETFGREGVNVASNLRDMADEVARVTEEMRKMTGTELSTQRDQLRGDKLNQFSRLAQGVEIVKDSALTMAFDNGMPDKQIGDILKTNMAMAGQKMMSPEYAAISDFTKNINLWWNKDEYASSAWSAQRAALMKDSNNNTEAIAIGDLTSGRTTLNRKVGFWENAVAGISGNMINIGDSRPGEWQSSGADVEGYRQFNKAYGIKATSEEYRQYVYADSTGDQSKIDEIVNKARDRATRIASSAEASKVVSMTPTQSIGSILGGTAGGLMGAALGMQIANLNPTAITPMPFTVSGEQIGIVQQQADKANQKYIDDEMKSLDEQEKKAKEDGRVIDIPRIAARRRSIKIRQDQLTQDADGFTAADRVTLRNEIEGSKSEETWKDAGKTLLEAAKLLKSAFDQQRRNKPADPKTPPQPNPQP